MFVTLQLLQNKFFLQYADVIIGMDTNEDSIKKAKRQKRLQKFLGQE